MPRRTAAYLISLTLFAIGCWQIIYFWLGAGNGGLRLIQTAGCVLLATAMIWAGKRFGHKIWIAAAFLALGLMLLPATVLVRVFPTDSAQPFASSLAFSLFMLMTASLVLAAILFSSGLAQNNAGRQADGKQDAGGQEGVDGTAVFLLVLSAVLMAMTIYYLYWLTVWDNTYDGLGYIWLLIPILTVFFAGFMLIITLPDRAKVAGYFYLLILPALLIAVSTFGQGVDFRQITEERAAQVSGALESYYSQNGRYPQELRQLTPRYILSLPEPAIIFGQDWCYDSREDAFTLGYVTRDHWSDPRLYGRVYRFTGAEPVDPNTVCGEEIAALKARAPQYYERQR